MSWLIQERSGLQTRGVRRAMSKRKDGVDEQYRDTYRRWTGCTYKGKHPSHLVKGATNVFPQTS